MGTHPIIVSGCKNSWAPRLSPFTPNPLCSIKRGTRRSTMVPSNEPKASPSHIPDLCDPAGSGVESGSPRYFGRTAAGDVLQRTSLEPGVSTGSRTKLGGAVAENIHMFPPGVRKHAICIDLLFGVEEELQRPCPLVPFPKRCHSGGEKLIFRRAGALISWPRWSSST